MHFTVSSAKYRRPFCSVLNVLSGHLNIFARGTPVITPSNSTVLYRVGVSTGGRHNAGGCYNIRFPPPKFILNSNLAKSHSSITPISMVKSLWNCAQGTAVILPCSVQNLKTISQLRNDLWASEILRDLGLRWVSEGTASAPSNRHRSSRGKQRLRSKSIIIKRELSRQKDSFDLQHTAILNQRYQLAQSSC